MGCIATGTRIHYGQANTAFISAQQWQQLREPLIGRVVEIGTSRDNPPAGSMGEWFRQNICRQALMSYVGAILLHENYAVRKSATSLRVIK